MSKFLDKPASDTLYRAIILLHCGIAVVVLDAGHDHTAKTADGALQLASLSPRQEANTPLEQKPCGSKASRPLRQTQALHATSPHPPQRSSNRAVFTSATSST